MVVSTTNLIRFFFYSAHLDYFSLAYCRISAVGKHIYGYPLNYPSWLAHLLAGIYLLTTPGFYSTQMLCDVTNFLFWILRASSLYSVRRTYGQKLNTEIVQRSPNIVIFFVIRMVHWCFAYLSMREPQNKQTHRPRWLSLHIGNSWDAETWASHKFVSVYECR